MSKIHIAEEEEGHSRCNCQLSAPWSTIHQEVQANTYPLSGRSSVLPSLHQLSEPLTVQVTD